MNVEGSFRTTDKKFTRFRFSVTVLLLFTIGCGSGDGSAKENIPEQQLSESKWVEGVFEPAGRFAALCEAPRSNTNPDRDPYPDTQGTLLDEMNWQRSWSNDIYLWYGEIIDRDPANFEDKLEYFGLLKTEELLPSGSPKDNPGFHFTYDTERWEQLQQSGLSYGYGVTWAILENREIVVAVTEPDTNATNPPANLSRGARVIAIDDVYVASAITEEEIDILNAGLFPKEDGETHRFTVLDLDSDTPRTFSLQAGNFFSTPVQSVQTIETDTGRVGYMLFKSHIGIAQEQLIEAMETLVEEEITDLVLDLRYNNGGLLALSSQLAYMVAGSANTRDKIYYFMQFNDKYQMTNPFSGLPNEPWPFIDSTLGYSSTEQSEGVPLPTLNLNRLFVLTTSRTCSASEALINGLRGVDVDVIQIGTTTC
jgi:hypothetical protein